MIPDPRLGTIGLLLFLVMFNAMAYVMAFRGQTPWPQSGHSVRDVKRTGVVFLIFGLSFLGFVVYRLATGTMPIRGATGTFGFGDFLRWEPPGTLSLQ